MLDDDFASVGGDGVQGIGGSGLRCDIDRGVLTDEVSALVPVVGVASSGRQGGAFAEADRRVARDDRVVAQQVDGECGGVLALVFADAGDEGDYVVPRTGKLVDGIVLIGGGAVAEVPVGGLARLVGGQRILAIGGDRAGVVHRETPGAAVTLGGETGQRITGCHARPQVKSAVRIADEGDVAAEDHVVACRGYGHRLLVGDDLPGVAFVVPCIVEAGRRRVGVGQHLAARFRKDGTTFTVHGEIGIAEVRTLRAVVGGHTCADGLSVICRNVEADIGPVFPVERLSAVGDLVPAGGRIARDETRISAGGVDAVAILVQQFEVEAGLLVGVVPGRVLQHGGVLQQQDVRLGGIDEKIIGDTLSFGTGFPVAQTHGVEFARRHRHQSAVGARVGFAHEVDGVTAGGGLVAVVHNAGGLIRIACGTVGADDVAGGEVGEVETGGGIGHAEGDQARVLVGDHAVVAAVVIDIDVVGVERRQP